jgi:uncharacterized LabA/DUF88 family protein
LTAADGPQRDAGQLALLAKLSGDHVTIRPRQQTDLSHMTPAADALITEVHSMEEKGSDVNLAAHPLNDAWKDLLDAGVVISNDTDLVTPIQMVTVERRKQVYVVCPGKKHFHPSYADRYARCIAVP